MQRFFYNDAYGLNHYLHLNSTSVSLLSKFWVRDVCERLEGLASFQRPNLVVREELGNMCLFRDADAPYILKVLPRNPLQKPTVFVQYSDCCWPFFASPSSTKNRQCTCTVSSFPVCRRDKTRPSEQLVCWRSTPSLATKIQGNTLTSARCVA